MTLRGKQALVTIAIVVGMHAVSFAESGVKPYRPAEGTEIHFIVPAGTSIVTLDPNAGESDMVIVTGRSVGVMSLFPWVVTGDQCADGWDEGHIQSATIVDPGDGRAARLTNQIVVTWLAGVGNYLPSPVAAGTRLTNITFDRQCRALGDSRFDRYRAVVQ